MMRRLAMSVAKIGGGVAAGTAALLIGCQHRMIYYPRAYGKHDVSSFVESGGRRLDFQTSCGRQQAYYLPPQSEEFGSEQVWMVCAGNGSLALDWLPILRRWNRRCGWLLVDYPGYGSCEGRPNPATIAENAVGAVDALARETGSSTGELTARMGAIGHSLGSSAALMAADRLELKEVVLVAPFTSMTEMARIVVGRPLCWLNRHRFDNRALLGSLAGRGARVHIFHGTDDEVVPVSMSRELAAGHPRAVNYHEIDGARHMSVLNAAADAIGALLED